MQRICLDIPWALGYFQSMIGYIEMDNLQYRTQDAYLPPHSCTRLFCNFDTLQYRDRTSLDARQLLLYNKPFCVAYQQVSCYQGR